MSRRSNNAKAARKMRKLFRRTPHAYIDLVTWLKDRGHAQTTGQAKALLLAGRVRVAANAVGRKSDPRARPHRMPSPNPRQVARMNPDVVEGWVLDPFIDARHRAEIFVKA